MAWDLLQYIAKEFIVRQVAEVNWCKVCVRWLGLITAHKFDSPLPTYTPLLVSLRCVVFLGNCIDHRAAMYLFWLLVTTSKWGFMICPNSKLDFLPERFGFAAKLGVTEPLDGVGHTKSLSTLIWHTLVLVSENIYYVIFIYLYLCRVTKIPTYADSAGS